MGIYVQQELPFIDDLVSKAIKELRAIAKTQDLCVRFSGGKDSIVVKRLCELAGVPFQTRFSKTSVDPPELLSYIKRYHSDVIIDKPKETMFQLIVKKGFPPTRVCRYCCRSFKEKNVCPKNDNTLTLTGIRKAESKRRGSRSKYETCQIDKGVRFFHPTIDWTDDQIWQFIFDERLPYCSIYDEGFPRIGCVGCPLTSSKKIIREFERWPQFEKAYLWAFDRMLEGRSFDKWKTKYDVMDWYIYGVQKKYEEIQIEGQWTLFHGDYYEQFELEPDWNPDTDLAKKILLN